MALVYSVCGLEHMSKDSLDAFKEHDLLTLSAGDCRAFVKSLRTNEYDLYCMVMENITESQDAVDASEVNDVVMFASNRESALMELFEAPMIKAVTRFIEAKLYDYDRGNFE